MNVIKRMELYCHRLLQEQFNFLMVKRMTCNFFNCAIYPTMRFGLSSPVILDNLDDGLARVSEYGLAGNRRKLFNTSLKVK